MKCNEQKLRIFISSLHQKVEVQADLVEKYVVKTLEKLLFEPIYDEKFRSFDFFRLLSSSRILLLHQFVVPAHIFRIFVFILFEDPSTKKFEWLFNSICSTVFARNSSVPFFSRKNFLTSVAGKNVL